MRFIIIGVVWVVFLVSCASDETSSYSVGSDFIDSSVQLRVVDTFSIKTGTFKLDSLITSSKSRILLGSVEESHLGHLTSQSYFQLVSSSYSISSDAVYDSIGFVLHYDTYYYGDTLQPQTYKIHRVTETVEPYEDADYFYNTSKLDYDTTETLGELTFVPRPTEEDSIYIAIDDVLGKEIFDKIADNDINTEDDFLQYFKGMTVVPNSTVDSHVLGFSALNYGNAENNSSMRLYYSIDEEDEETEDNYYIDFYISQAAKQFNAISSDLTTTKLNTIEDIESIASSEDTDDLFYAQSGTGISARIEIPFIRNLNQISNTGTQLGAELTFAPLEGTYDDNKPLESYLVVYIVDSKNRIVSQLTTIDGSEAYAVLNQSEDEFNHETYYSINLGGFVETILSSEQNLNYALMIQFPDYDMTVKNVVLKNEDVKLTVNYLNY